MTREQAIRKISACLRLANNPGAGEHEAARALHHAQKMMEEHGITDSNIAAAKASKYTATRPLPKNREPQWSIHLSNIISKAFGVAVIRDRGVSSSACVFIGVAPAPEVAGYTWDVLYRQLKRSRSQYLATLPKRLKRQTKTRRGDIFAQAWVGRVASTVRRFAGTDQSQAIAAYKAEHYPALASEIVTGAAAKNHDHGAFFAGRRAADGVRLDRPVGKGVRPSRLEAKP